MKKFISVVWVGLLALLLSACGEEKAENTLVEENVQLMGVSQLKEGEHYFKYKNIVKTSDTNLADADLIEFFSYACGHCQSFAPELQAWHNENPKKEVAYVPVVWNQQTAVYARLFYALEQQPGFDKNHHDLFVFFKGLGGEKNLAEQLDKIYAFLDGNGVDTEKLKATLESKELEEKLKYSVELAKNYEIRGTPTLVVAGSMVVNDKALKSHDDFWRYVDELLTL
ncbi:DsbA family protein [Litoribacillus peritrichatus]|uniref:Thiol:disulfide interchange protein DsbA/DsbL n=1 Tax=Litoribacillus peritrichatus TaxID=718191 RepID=A0ABP7N8A1_9GAMM